MARLADALPLIAVLGLLGLTVLLIRLNRRISRGSKSAGPRSVEPPTPAGLAATPWELEAIDMQLRSPAGSTARRDLVATVNRLIAAGRDRTDLAPIPLDASNGQIEQIIDVLEARLDLTPDPPPLPPEVRAGSGSLGDG